MDLVGSNLVFGNTIMHRDNHLLPVRAVRHAANLLPRRQFAFGHSIPYKHPISSIFMGWVGILPLVIYSNYSRANNLKYQ